MRTLKILTMIVPLSIVSVGARAEEPEVFREMLSHYESIRLALVADNTTDVQENAVAIADTAELLFDAYDARIAGVPEKESEAGRAILGEIAAAAAEVAAAPDLEAVRELFFELSKPMGRYRKLTGDTSSIVMFCPMAKKAWLQPDGEVGNPYYGQAMPTCGNHVPD